MKIDDLLKKPLWERRLPDTVSVIQREGIDSGVEKPFVWDNGKKMYLSQRDFLNELDPNSHQVYNIAYRSPRKKMRYDETQKKNVEDGYEEIARVAIAYQQTILAHKVTHTFGNDIWIGNDGSEEDDDYINKVKTHINISGLKHGFLNSGRSAFGTGDTAIYLYIEKGKIKFKVFSYENGDIVTQKWRNGERIGVRAFPLNGRRAVELYTSRYVELWVNKSDMEDELFLDEVRNIIRGDVNILDRSEDDYVLVRRTEHSYGKNTFSYYREKDVCWGVGQRTIEEIENSLSDLSENNAYYAFQILFMRGGAVSLPSAKKMGKVIGSKSENGDAKILQPADASNTFQLALDKNEQALADSTMTVFVRVEDIKGGDPSGAYLTNLYFPETQWAIEAYSRMNDFITDVLDTFVRLVGIIEKDEMRYSKLMYSYMFTPYVPRNLMEEATMLANGYTMGILSRETAATELSVASPNELKRLENDDSRKEEEKQREQERKQSQQLGITNAAENKPTE